MTSTSLFRTVIMEPAGLASGATVVNRLEWRLQPAVSINAATTVNFASLPEQWIGLWVIGVLQRGPARPASGGRKAAAQDPADGQPLNFRLRPRVTAAAQEGSSAPSKAEPPG